MKNNYLKKAALATMITLAGSEYNKINPHELPPNNHLERMLEREKIFNQKIKEQSSDEIKAPKYKTEGSECSRYVRKSAEDLFGKTYFWRDAWNLRYPSKIVHTFNETEGEKLEKELKDLIIDGILTPGAVIGIKQPDNQTTHENETDEEKKKAKYTHVAVYAGLDSSGRPEFLHEYGFDQKKISLDFFKEKNFTPIEILVPKEDKTYFAQSKDFQSKKNEI
jgi:hypothetical protein